MSVSTTDLLAHVFSQSFSNMISIYQIDAFSIISEKHPPTQIKNKTPWSCSYTSISNLYTVKMSIGQVLP